MFIYSRLCCINIYVVIVSPPGELKRNIVVTHVKNGDWARRSKVLGCLFIGRYMVDTFCLSSPHIRGQGIQWSNSSKTSTNFITCCVSPPPSRRPARQVTTERRPLGLSRASHGFPCVYKDVGENASCAQPSFLLPVPVSDVENPGKPSRPVYVMETFFCFYPHIFEVKKSIEANRV
jgi:hypothetical protein